jgi:plasmid stability protein
MVNVLVRDLPEDVHRELAGRAERSGQSLQQFLRSELERLARREPLDEVLARIDKRRGGKVPIESAAAIVREDRDHR